ncbi:MAG: hypothetical protein AVDCRST_MAG89-4457, partial [uncultured Gemmatimonadetes bacterium]
GNLISQLRRVRRAGAQALRRRRLRRGAGRASRGHRAVSRLRAPARGAGLHAHCPRRVRVGPPVLRIGPGARRGVRGRLGGPGRNPAEVRPGGGSAQLLRADRRDGAGRRPGAGPHGGPCAVPRGAVHRCPGALRRPVDHARRQRRAGGGPRLHAPCAGRRPGRPPRAAPGHPARRRPPRGAHLPVAPASRPRRPARRAHRTGAGAPGGALGHALRLALRGTEDAAGRRGRGRRLVRAVEGAPGGARRRARRHRPPAGRGGSLVRGRGRRAGAGRAGAFGPDGLHDEDPGPARPRRRAPLRAPRAHGRGLHLPGQLGRDRARNARLVRRAADAAGRLHAARGAADPRTHRPRRSRPQRRGLFAGGRADGPAAHRGV